MYYCERCGKQVEVKFGSGRFCSRACANTRAHTDETKEKIRQTLLKRYPNSCNGKKPSVKKTILDGQALAKCIGLADSPYNEYNTAFLRKQVGGRNAYAFCFYEGNHLIKREIVLEYRYLMAVKLGRKLTPKEVVHHIDSNKFNNSIENLEITTQSEHARTHAKQGSYYRFPKGYSPWNKGMKGCFSEESIKKLKAAASRKRKHKQD